MNTLRVLLLKWKHRNTWRTQSERKWRAGLYEEVLELFMALDGFHDDDPRWELMQIAAIALNWLDYYDRIPGSSKDRRDGV